MRLINRTAISVVGAGPYLEWTRARDAAFAPAKELSVSVPRAKPFGSVDQMIVLNGAQGLSEALAAALSQGVAGLQLARNLLSGGNGAANGAGGEAGDRGSLQAPEPARKDRKP